MEYVLFLENYKNSQTFLEILQILHKQPFCLDLLLQKKIWDVFLNFPKIAYFSNEFMKNR